MMDSTELLRKSLWYMQQLASAWHWKDGQARGQHEQLEELKEIIFACKNYIEAEDLKTRLFAPDASEPQIGHS